MNKEEPSLPNIAVSALAVTGGLVIMVVIAAIAYLPNRPDTVAQPGMSPEERRELLQEKRERDRTELSEYGWINRNQGRVRLPIDRAIELAVAEIEEEGTIAVREFSAPEEEEAPEEEDAAAENGEAEGEQEETSDGNGESEEGGESGAEGETDSEDNAGGDDSGEGDDNENDNDSENVGTENG